MNITNNFKVTGGITLYHVRGGPAPPAGLHFTFCEPSSVCSSSFSPLTPTCKMEHAIAYHKDLRGTGIKDRKKIQCFHDAYLSDGRWAHPELKYFCQQHILDYVL